MLESSQLKVHVSGGASQKVSTQTRDNALKSGKQILSFSLSHTHPHTQIRIMLENTHLNVTPVSGGVRQKLIIQIGDKWKQLNSKC